MVSKDKNIRPTRVKKKEVVESPRSQIPRGVSFQQESEQPSEQYSEPSSDPYSEPVPPMPKSSSQTSGFETTPNRVVISIPKSLGIPRRVTYPVYPEKVTYYGMVTDRGIPVVDGGILTTSYGGQTNIGRGGSFSIYDQRANDIMFYLYGSLLDVVRMIHETTRVYVELAVRRTSQRKQVYTKKKKIVKKKRKV